MAKAQKVFALVPFKNEAHNFETFFQNIHRVVDLVIGFDDNSVDASKIIFNKLGGKLIDYEGDSHWGRGGESIIRNRLLETGRKLGGTHFLVLDADEYISSSNLETVKSEILDLPAGRALALSWVNLWKDYNQTCGPNTPWAPRLKDFAFADTGQLLYPSTMLHFSRTPTINLDKPWVNLNQENVVIHTQFAQWNRAQLKQAWYRCLELVFTNKKARHINLTYEITKDNSFIEVIPTKKEWIDGVSFPSDLEEFELDWHAKEIFSWFEEKGPLFFERLDIWHIKMLRDYFEAHTGRSPRKPLYPSLLRKQVAMIRGKLG